MLRQCISLSILTIFLAIISFLASSHASADFRSDMLKAADPKTGGEFVRARFLKEMKKPFNPSDNRPKALLIGDSHAQDFYNAILESGAMSGYQLSTRYIPTVCQMYLGPENITGLRDARHASICAKSDTLAQSKAQIAEADVVILASNWKAWSAQRLPESIRNLGLRPDQKLVVLGRKSYGKPNVRKYARMPENQLRTLRNEVDVHQLKINNILRSSIPAHQFVDQHQLICGGGNTCPVFTNDLGLISFDGGHFTPQGAKYVGEVLFNTPQLRSLR